AGLRCETRLVQHRIEEVAGAVPGEGSAGAVGAMRARRQSQHQHPCRGISKGWNRAAPVLPARVGFLPYRSNLAAVLAKPGAALAGYNASVQFVERTRRRLSHGLILTSLGRPRAASHRGA